MYKAIVQVPGFGFSNALKFYWRIHNSHFRVGSRYLIDVDPSVFAMWDVVDKFYINMIILTPNYLLFYDKKSIYLMNTHPEPINSNVFFALILHFYMTVMTYVWLNAFTNSHLKHYLHTNKYYQHRVPSQHRRHRHIKIVAPWCHLHNDCPSHTVLLHTSCHWPPCGTQVGYEATPEMVDSGLLEEYEDRKLIGYFPDPEIKALSFTKFNTSDGRQSRKQ